MKNVIPKKAFNWMLSVLCVGGLFFIASCGSDDPAPDPTTISFSSTTASVAENDANGFTATVTFSEASNIAGTFAISITSANAVYGDDYTTTPDGSSGTINVTVAAGDESVSVTMNPIDNDEFMGDKTVTFTLADVTGLELGTNGTLTVTITDDEMMPTEISSLRSQYATSGAGTIEGPAIIEGIVTSARDNITGRNIFIQDATAGIVVRFDEDNVDFDLGDLLRIDISGATLDAFDALVQISDLPLTAATERGTGTLPDPVDVTITELLTDDFQGQIVRLSDVAVEGADGTRTFGGSLTFIDVDGNEVGSFVRSGANFNGNVIPTGTGTVIGIASSFSETAQIDLRSDSDLDFSLTADIVVDASNLTDFGMVATQTTSSSQSYMLSGTDLLADINIEAPNNFEISLDDTNFSDEVTVDAASASSGVTVYVRFAPASGTNGMIDGNITHTSFGAVEENVGVSGEETGNGSAGMPTDLFFSEYVEGSSNNKYLEIFNGTGASIDLSDYEIRRFNNGGNDASGSTYALGGTLADGEVIVIANGSADIYSGTVYSATDAEGATFFNGDDAIVLYKVSSQSEIDIFGQVECDPGSAWSDGDHSTQNKTLRRKSSVISGVTTNPTGECGPTSFETLTTEWDVFDQNTADGLGAHTIN